MPIVRTLYSIINDGIKPDNNESNVEACHPYVLATHDHIVSDDSIEEDPPPPQPSPSPTQESSTPSLSYNKIFIDKWNELVHKSKGYTKSRSSKPLLTEAQIREEVKIVRMLNRVDTNIRVQCDGEANTSVTNDVTILHYKQDIPEYSIGGIGDGIKCTMKGIFYL